MIEKFLGMMVGYWAAKFLDAFFGSSTSSSPGGAVVPNPAAAPTPTTVKEGQRPAVVPPGAIPVVAPSAVPAPEAAPAGLPPFPSGWTFVKPTDAIVQRAWALLPLLKMGQVKYETSPGDPNRWLAYRKEPHAQGKTGVTVYTPRNVPAATVSPPMVFASNPAAPSSSSSSSSVRDLRRGMKGPDVAAWQHALNVRGIKPQLVEDGDFGKGTDGATRAFQRSRGLKEDGVVGPQTRALASAVTT